MATNTTCVKFRHILPEDKNGVLLQSLLLTLSEFKISLSQLLTFLTLKII